MTRQAEPPERIGVVVIHGVGPARPGWINKELLDHLQGERAFDLADHSEVHELEVQVLDEGSDEAAAAASGLGAQLSGILQGQSQGQEIEVTERELEQEHPEQPAGSKDAFSAYVRRAAWGKDKSRNVTFVELFWADLSRVGDGWISTGLVALQMFYEAPLVLSAAFMRDQRTGLRLYLAWLIRTANWLLRWPLSGLNISIFVTALALYAVEALRGKWPEHALAGIHDVYVVGLTLLAVAAGAHRLSRRDADDTSILRSELAPSTARFAFVLLVALVAVRFWLGPERLEGLAAYLVLASMPILFFWALWSHIVAAAIGLLAAVALRWYLPFREPDADTPMRPAAALGLTMVQGVIWKVVIALAWSILIYTLVPAATEIDVCAPPADSSDCQLGNLYTSLIMIVSMNMIMAGVLAVSVLFLFEVRRLIVKWRHDPDAAREIWLPRVIVSRFAVILMFLLTVANLCLFYGPGYLSALKQLGLYNSPMADAASFAWVKAHAYRDVAAIGWAGVLVLLFFGVFASSAHGVLHIIRDLVDHQYTRVRLKAGGDAVTLGSKLMRLGLALRQARIEQSFPRRERIIARFDTLMRRIVSNQQCDRLVLVGHSQGSIILYDYLRSKWDDGTLSSVDKIDIVTLGSPLGHIYQPYFADYEDTIVGKDRLNHKLESWTNLWRIDDPVGNRIDIVRRKDGTEFIVNEILGPGGHMDYWKEGRVCAVIAGLIDPEVRRTLPPPLPAAARSAEREAVA